MEGLQLTGLDLAIIGIYLVAVTVIGFAMAKRASKSVESYLLGGKDIPWYMLGLSNASGMFDISGTMWLVTIGFVYGLKSIWLPWLFWLVCLPLWVHRTWRRRQRGHQLLRAAGLADEVVIADARDPVALAAELHDQRQLLLAG